MKKIIWYEVTIYTAWWDEYKSMGFNSLKEAEQEMKKHENAIIRKRKTLIWGKYEKLQQK